MSALSNKVAIVTGASSGIGYAAAKLFASEGAKVVAAARRQPELDALVKEVTQAGGHAVALAGDVKDEAFARALVELAIHRFGGLDVAFNNAGTLGEMGATPDVSLSGWEDTIKTNLTSAFLGAKYQIPAMLDRGRRVPDLYLDLRRLHCGLSGDGGLCREQGRPNWPHANAGVRVWGQGYSGERSSAGRYGYAHGSNLR